MGLYVENFGNDPVGNIQQYYVYDSTGHGFARSPRPQMELSKTSAFISAPSRSIGNMMPRALRSRYSNRKKAGDQS
jgi:hypothetical protein